jgi:hypothetical protein
MPAVAEAPKRELIKDRMTVAETVADWMAENCRNWSIDTLLTHPAQATAMAKWVCRKLGRKATDEAIHEICRAALSSRKRGDLTQGTGTKRRCVRIH